MKGCRGQASVEALALIPLMAIAVLVAVQLAVLLRGAFAAQDRARDAALSARGAGTVTVRAAVRVPSLLPGVGRLEIPVRAVVRAR